MRRIESETDIADGVAALARIEPRFAIAAARTGAPPLRRRAPGFAGLLRIVVGQQVSTAAAAAIWARLEAAGADRPERAAGLGAEGLGALGLSRPKARYAVALAEAVGSGALDFAALAAAPDEAAAAALRRLPGVGPWTAEAYLLICEGRADIFPAGDLALQEAARRLFGTEARPSAAALAVRAAAWSPWRAVAARLLWAYYALETGRAGAPAADLPGAKRRGGAAKDGDEDDR